MSGLENTVIFVNDVHPHAPHVSAKRIWQMASACARMGRRTIVLTQSTSDHPAHNAHQDMSERLRDTACDHPIIVSVDVPVRSWVRRAREGGYPFGLRQALLAAAQIHGAGHFQDWYNAAMTYSEILIATKPIAVIGTFGNIGNWAIAQALAKGAGCPWIGDVKDNWITFTQPGFRELLRRRYQDMAHMTLYSESHGDVVAPYFTHSKTVIYSGFEDGSNDPPHITSGVPHLLMTGSLYSEDAVAQLISGLRLWQQQGSPNGDGSKPVLSYAGNDAKRFLRATGSLKPWFDIEPLGFLSSEDLATASRRATVNIYVVNPNSLFQNKFLELLSAGRPILTLPPEGEEAQRIAEACHGTLYTCEDAEQVARSLVTATTQPVETFDPSSLSEFTTARQMEKLLTIIDTFSRRAQ